MLAADFIWRALAGGIGVALVTGPLGCFVVWRRMAYFGDTLGHSALLGVALGYLLGINLTVGVMATALTVALLLAAGLRQQILASDTLLGILAHGALALGLVLLSFLPTLRVDLLAYLFGDILAVGRSDVIAIWLAGAGLLVALGWLWRPLLAITVHEDLARVEGVAIEPTKLAFTLMLAVTVAVALKLVGIVLVTSLLIIPAAAARRFAATPEQMAAGAAGLGTLTVIGGLAASLLWDTPSGPSIVLAAVILFAILQLVPRRGLSAPH